jgi:hypothetical protein
MHHHPLGKKEQRKNEGIVDFSSRKHQIRSLWGSSGASIVLKKNPKEIVAIHTGYHSSTISTELVKYVGSGSPIDIFAVESNGFEIITNNEFININKNGKKLYSMGKEDLSNYMGSFPKTNRWW